MLGNEAIILATLGLRQNYIITNFDMNTQTSRALSTTTTPPPLQYVYNKLGVIEQASGTLEHPLGHVFAIPVKIIDHRDAQEHIISVSCSSLLTITS